VEVLERHGPVTLVAVDILRLLLEGAVVVVAVVAAVVVGGGGR
jgi:hypothetical protein